MNKSRVLIWGYGSIGKKHELAFEKLGCEVGILSKRDFQGKTVFKDIETALTVFLPDLVVISNKTCEHLGSLESLRENQFNGKILVEKPLFKNLSEITPPKGEVFVAYNLRFNAIIQKLKEELQNKKIISSQVYCGEYLPKWRPNSNYKDSYSASSEEGGGVLRDLSHELDYSFMLFGEPLRLAALGGKDSHLDISSDDHFSVLAETANCLSLGISVNYLDKITQRKINIVCDNDTYNADLIHGTLRHNGRNIYQLTEKENTYVKQAKAILGSDYSQLCTLKQGLVVMKAIYHIEMSAKEKTWREL
jgi:predicted dehydrogenase